MKVTSLIIPDVKLITPEVFRDQRGYFFESWQTKKFAAMGIPYSYVQDNQSKSIRNVLRGLHYQIRQPQGKLIRVLSGEIFDVAVDIRRASPTFGKWVGQILNADTCETLWVPPGFAHGFCVLSDAAEILYKATDYYAPVHERAIRFDDPVIGIDWPLTGEPILSEKDRIAPFLKDAEVYEGLDLISSNG